ncbi:DEAD/DEAH box helicase [Sulfuracidifex tepidarius]|uniref:DNA 3'-5' helicase n=1 Tax=Sulfuracidifex tepidarius TaxID=1294262 RepID=A0A510E3I9_9CREN|nr:DEAD/DEAH box helicase [Sulfuracidifex tepidarius]BBG26628.1 ATP-dependent RNA helicase RhlB [Sulfuracidifex tepidarius]
MILKTFCIEQKVDKATFNDLVKFSRFLGKSGSCYQFAIDSERAIQNRVKPDDIFSLLDELGIPLMEQDRSKILESIYPYDAEFLIHGDKLLLKPHVYLADIFKGRVSSRAIFYDRYSKVFVVKPSMYFAIKRLLEENGLVVKEIDLPHNIKVDFTGQLRAYQVEAIDTWKNKGMRGVISLPTGSGKTVIGVAAVAEAKVPTLVVSFTKEQLLQWKDAMLNFSTVRDVGLFYSKEKRIEDVTITTYQTAFRHIKEIWNKFGLLIIDEAHHLPADKFRIIAENCLTQYKLGLSATPYREDGRHEFLFSMMGGVVYSKEASELIAKGYLAPYELIQVKVDLTPLEKKKYFELLKRFRTFSKGRSVMDLIKNVKKGDPNAVNAMKIYSELKKVVNLSENKLKKVQEIIEENRDKKILVFTQYVDQAERIARNCNASLLTGKTPHKEREDTIKNFKSSPSGVLVLTTVGDEGLDIPDANVGIIVAGTSSRRQFIQRLGRLLRSSEGKKALLYEVIVKGTSEEYQSRKRKSVDILDSLDD